MLGIKQRGEKWRIKITEEWEFESLELMMICFNYLVALKKKHGSLEDHY